MNMNSISFKLKIIYENLTLDITLASTDTVATLKERIADGLNPLGVTTKPNNITIRYGYPPKTIQDSSLNMKSLNEIGISNNEVLRIEVISNSLDDDQIHVQVQSNSQSEGDYSDPIDFSKYSVFRKIIPADNSCLFNAVNFAINQSINEPDIMRSLISIEIQSNPDIFNEAVLGKTPEEYCEWIMSSDTWGGGIELSIISKCFQIKIGVVDIKNITIEYFGEDYSEIIYLLYDNVHYDVFAKTKDDGSTTGVFKRDDMKTRNEMLEIAKELNKKSQFVDTKGFSIKCNICYTLLKGEQEAIAHSKSTKHTNFVQVGK